MLLNLLEYSQKTPMLESLTNKVAVLQNCCKAYLLHTLLRFYFSLGKNLKNFIHKGIFRTKSNIYSGAFFTLVKPDFKNVLNLIELPLGSIFYTTDPFVKKFRTLKISGEKVLTMKHFFFWNSKLCNGMASSIKTVFQISIS